MSKNKNSILRRVKSASVIATSNGAREERDRIKRSSSLGDISKELLEEGNTESAGYSDTESALDSEAYLADLEDSRSTDGHHTASGSDSDSESDLRSEAYLADEEDEVNIKMSKKKQKFSEEKESTHTKRKLSNRKVQVDLLEGYEYENLQIPTQQADGLTIFTMPLNTKEKSEETYETDGQKFQLQNVSGSGLDCFFNATGLKRKEQVAKLKKYANNPVIRYMVANDIIAGTIAATEGEFNTLPTSTQEAIGYTDYKSRIVQIANIELDRNQQIASKIKNSGAERTDSELPFETLVDREIINKEDTQAKQELTNTARTLKAYNAFVNDFIGKNKMLGLSPDAKDNMLPYTSIDAIAYVNEFGIKVYGVAKDKHKRVIKGKLALIHEFIPRNSKMVIYLYHEGEHFQTLIPNQELTAGKKEKKDEEEFSYIIQMPEYDTIVMPFSKFKKTLLSLKALKKIKTEKNNLLLPEIINKLDELNKHSATIQFVLPNLSITEADESGNTKIEIQSFTNTEFTTEINQLSIPNNILEKIFETVVTQIDDIQEEDRNLLRTKEDLRIVIIQDKGFVMEILKEFRNVGLQTISEQLGLASTLNAGKIDVLQFSLLLGSVLAPKFGTGALSSLSSIWEYMSWAKISNSYKNFAISNIPKNLIHSFGKNLGKIGGFLAWVASGVMALNAFSTTDENEGDYKAMQTAYGVLLLSAAILGSIPKWLDHKDNQKVKLKN